MKALILAAGEGTRLRPLTLARPKPMLPIGDRPLLEHLVTWLRSHGIVDIAINLHHQPQAITEHFGDGSGWGVSITYSYEEELLGTAGAAKKLQPFFDQTFVVVYGDVLTNLAISRLGAYHSACRTALATATPMLTLALYRVANPTACGLVETDAQGRVGRFVEKPPPDQVFTDMANSGVMVLEPDILDYVPAHVPFDFGHDLFPRLLDAGVPMFGLPLTADEYLVDIGTPAGYARAQQIWQRQPSYPALEGQV